MDEIRALVGIQFSLIATVPPNITLIAFIPPTFAPKRTGRTRCNPQWRDDHVLVFTPDHWCGPWVKRGHKTELAKVDFPRLFPFLPHPGSPGAAVSVLISLEPIAHRPQTRHRSLCFNGGTSSLCTPDDQLILRSQAAFKAQQVWLSFPVTSELFMHRLTP